MSLINPLCDHFLDYRVTLAFQFGSHYTPPPPPPPCATPIGQSSLGSGILSWVTENYATGVASTDVSKYRLLDQSDLMTNCQQHCNILHSFRRQSTYYNLLKENLMHLAMSQRPMRLDMNSITVIRRQYTVILLFGVISTYIWGSDHRFQHLKEWKCWWANYSALSPSETRTIYWPTLISFLETCLGKWKFSTEERCHINKFADYSNKNFKEF